MALTEECDATNQPYADREKMIRLTIAVERLTDEVARLSAELRHVNEKRLTDIEKIQAVADERLGRMQSIVYGTLAAAGTQTIGIIAAAIAWAITRYQ
jgi:hypothetical protein